MSTGFAKGWAVEYSGHRLKRATVQVGGMQRLMLVLALPHPAAISKKRASWLVRQRAFAEALGRNWLDGSS